jgi:hypothetical protein
MFTKTKMLAATVLLAGAVFGHAAHAAAPVVVDLSSDPTAWGPNGQVADIMVHYDSLATIPVTISVPQVVDTTGNPVSQYPENGCPGARFASGDGGVIASYTLPPGSWCWIRAGRTPDDVQGFVSAMDGTTTTTNIATHLRASLEVLDQNGNVVNHSPLH